MTNRPKYLAAALALAVVATAGCTKPKSTDSVDKGSDTGKEQVVEGGTLYLSMFSGPKGVFNPILHEEKYDANVIDLVFDGLLRLNDKLEYICNLCDNFNFSTDNKTVTFKLKKGLKWHDGQPVTSADAAFTFRSILHPEYTGVRTTDYTALIGVQKMLDARDAIAQDVKDKKMSDADAAAKNKSAWEAWLNGDGKRAINVIDAETISFTTDEPYAPFLQSLAMNIIPEHIYKSTEVGKMESNPAVKQPIGTGPFKFVEYKTDQYVKLERNPDYHLGKPNIQTIIYKVVNQDVAIGQLKSGDLDFIDLKPSDVDLVQNETGIKVYTRPDFGYQYMGFNTDKPQFKDKSVRQAIVYGINRKAIVDRLLKGYGTVMNSHMPPALWAYDEKSLNPYTYDTKKAAELLAQAGWKDKNSEGYLTRAGQVFEFTLKYPSGNKVREASAPLIQANLKDIGIKVNLQMSEFATLSSAVFDKRDMDAWLMGWSLSVDPDPGSIFLPDNKWGKVTGWTNSRSEQLIKDGVKVLDVSKRKPTYVEWAKIMNEDLPYAFLYSQNVIDAVRVDKVKGLKPDARGTLWNWWELWIPKDKQG